MLLKHFIKLPFVLKKQKIALCIYGRYNNRLDPKRSGNLGFKYIKKNIIKRNNVDMFIYSTDLKNQEIIQKKYKKYIKNVIFCEEQDFSKIIKQNSINKSLFVPLEPFRTLENTLSFLYNRKKSIELKQKFESENDFKYDVVVTCRFDLGQIDKHNGFKKHKYKVSEINFDPKLNMDFIYSAMWNQLNAGYADQWFYSSSANIDILTKMYDNVIEYFQKNSKYLQHIVNGLIDSNIDDEFSNEFFTNNKTKNLKKYDIKDAINNHLLHKYYFIDTGLYEKSRFI